MITPESNQEQIKYQIDSTPTENILKAFES